MGASAVIASTVGGGGYINLLKILPVLIILLLWARLLTWVDKDAEELRLPREMINIGLLGGFVVAFGLFFGLPNFFLATLALIAVLGVEAGVYLNIRKSKASFKDLQKEFATWVKTRGGKKVEKKVEAAAGQVSVIKRSGEPTLPPDEESPDRPFYDGIQVALKEGLAKGADQIELAPEAEGIVAKYVVDGVSYRAATLASNVGAGVISKLKEAAGLIVDEVRKPQVGSFKVTFEGKKRDVKAQTAGTRAGEYMRLIIDPKKRPQLKVDDLGFSEKQLAQIKELIKEKNAIVILSTPKGQGLTTLLHGLLRGHDAFVEHIQSIEREQEGEVEGVTQTRLPVTATPEEESKKVDWVISQEPDVIGISPVESPQSATQLIAYAKSGKIAYVGMRASSTFEAMDHWRKLVGDSRSAMEALKLVVNGRVLRRLCEACKAGYTPDPATLRKLGINPEKVTTLYQARTQPLRDQKGNPLPCQFCNELHFKGRMGVFETLTVDDEVRETVNGGKSPTQVFRKQRGRYLQEEALALVERGETSVQEVLRVLKAAAAPPPAAGGAAAAAPAAPARPIGGSAKLRRGSSV